MKMPSKFKDFREPFKRLIESLEQREYIGPCLDCDHYRERIKMKKPLRDPLTGDYLFNGKWYYTYPIKEIERYLYELEEKSYQSLRMKSMDTTEIKARLIFKAIERFSEIRPCGFGETLLDGFGEYDGGLVFYFNDMNGSTRAVLEKEVTDILAIT